MVTIEIVDVVNNHFTNEDGNVIYHEILDNFKNDKEVIISFKDISGVNSSFVNSAFIQLLEIYDFDYVKKNLKFVDSNRQINQLIKSRFSFENNKQVSV